MNSSQSAQSRNSPADDRRWIQETLAGDDNAFSHLVEKYKDPLFELASRILKNRAEAEDILQDAFIQAYRHLGDFRNDSQFSTWLYSIVLNRIRNKMRQGKVLRWCSLDARRPDHDDAYLPEMPHRGPPIDVLTEKKMELEKVEQIVNSFPLHYQSVFIMHYFENFSLEEVSRRLGRPLGTVKVYLHRARKLLYKRLQTEEEAAAAARASVSAARGLLDAEPAAV